MTTTTLELAIVSLPSGLNFSLVSDNEMRGTSKLPRDQNVMGGKAIEKDSTPTLGQMAYEAYCAQIGSVAMQPWSELGEPVRQAWYEASIAVVAWTWKKQYRAMMEKWEK